MHNRTILTGRLLKYTWMNRGTTLINTILINTNVNGIITARGTTVYLSEAIL